MIGGINYIDIFDIKKKNNSNNKNFFYINGRIALNAILNSLNHKRFKTVYIPNYICQSIIDHIPKKFKINFYEVNNNLDIKLPQSQNSIIIIINFFGKIFKVPKEIKMNNVIIEDQTFSFKRFIKKNNKKEFFFASLRKLYPSMICSISSLKNKNKKIPDKKILTLYKQSLVGSLLKKSYQKGNYYSKNKNLENEYLNKINLIDEFFNKNKKNFKVNDLFLNYYSVITFSKNQMLLKKNKQWLKKKLINLKKIKIINNMNILFLLIYSKKKKKFINFLKKRKIYISDYWKRPKKLYKKNLSHDLYENLIVMPNSHYYQKFELENIQRNIKFFLNKNEI